MWFTFIFYGILFYMIICLLKAHKVNKIIRISLIIFSLIGLIIFVYSADYTLLERRIWYNCSPYVELTYFLMMILGMIARYITKAIDDRNERITKIEKIGDYSTKPKVQFDGWNFSYPFFVSILTFGFLLQQIKTETLNISEVVLSFQTGFFWQTILGKN